MALYQGYDGGKINVNISGGSGVDKNGFTMKGDIEMGGNEVKGLGAPTDDTSAVTKKWVDDEIIKQAAIMFHNITLKRRKTTTVPIPNPAKVPSPEDPRISTTLRCTTDAPLTGRVVCTFFAIFLGTTVFPLRVSR